MPLATSKALQEILATLTSYIDSGQTLDPFSFKKFLTQAERIPDEANKLMVLALAHGAAGSSENAIGYFLQAVEFKDDIIARNFLVYLARTGHLELYNTEAVRLAKAYESYPLSIRARNVAYSQGDGQLALFFSRKAISMRPENKDLLEGESAYRLEKLDKFHDITKMSTLEISELAMMINNIAKNHGVMIISNEFYTSGDNDAAIICDVVCDDPDILSDMDIEVATEIAIDERFSAIPATAWFRGRDPKDMENTL